MTMSGSYGARFQSNEPAALMPFHVANQRGVSVLREKRTTEADMAMIPEVNIASPIAANTRSLTSSATTSRTPPPKVAKNAAVTHVGACSSAVPASSRDFPSFWCSGRDKVLPVEEMC